jgi:hypothetical protein
LIKLVTLLNAIDAGIPSIEIYGDTYGKNQDESYSVE